MEQFRYVVEGAIGPESFRVRELLSLFEKLEQAIAIESGIRAGEVEKQSPIRIVSLKPGSFDCAFKTLDRFNVGARKVVAAHQRRDSSFLKPRSIRLLRNVHERFVEQGATTFRLRSEGAEDRLDVSWTAQQLLPEPGPDQFFHGETDLLVFVIRIGGLQRPTAKVRVLDGDYVFTVNLANKEQALQFKEYLYKNVIIKGTARWDRDWELDRFDVLSIFQPPENATVAFENVLHHLNGGISFASDSEVMSRIRGDLEQEEPVR
jgi:hypothetical protein